MCHWNGSPPDDRIKTRKETSCLERSSLILAKILGRSHLIRKTQVNQTTTQSYYICENTLIANKQSKVDLLYHGLQKKINLVENLKPKLTFLHTLTTPRLLTLFDLVTFILIFVPWLPSIHFFLLFWFSGWNLCPIVCLSSVNVDCFIAVCMCVGIFK
jgi:hypothetical protein